MLKLPKLLRQTLPLLPDHLFTSTSLGIGLGHVEVQVSHNPVSYVCGLPKELQKAQGVGASRAKKRCKEDMQAAVRGWIAKKFDGGSKAELRERLGGSTCLRELVIHRVKFAEE